jgi:aryl-alcohol dehydrogenase-like predicted oxidoreductase
MELRPLGRTGVHVSALCLGAMMFGEWGTKDHDQSIRIIHRAFDAGINFIDTADVYSAGESEEIVGKAIAGRRDDIVLATKIHMPMGDDPNRRGNSRRWIIAEVENSLRRLGTDWIDIYQVHRYDPAVDLEVTLGALTDLMRAGKIRYAGHSTWPVSAIVEAQWTAQRRAVDRPWTEQPTYSILTRGIENDVLPTCSRYGYGVLSYSPLAGGWLSGRYRRDEQTGPMSPARQRLANRFDLSLPENQHKLDAAEALAQLAGQAGISLIEMAIAFVLRHPAITSAIIGPRTMDHLETQLPAAEVRLSDDILDAIDRIVAPGVTLNPADDGWVSPALEPAARRR